MNRARRPPLPHPMALLFYRAVDSFTVSLSPETTRHYHGTARNFLSYLHTQHPDVILAEGAPAESFVDDQSRGMRSASGYSAMGATIVFQSDDKGSVSFGIDISEGHVRPGVVGRGDDE